MNTLRMRLIMDGTGVEESIKKTHEMLAELLQHEHASLALAQRCSQVPAHEPLFSALLNYRHGAPPKRAEADGPGPLEGVEWLGGEERTNYPLTLSVDDFGDALGLSVQTVLPLSPERVCDYMERALEALAEALAHAPSSPVRGLEVLPLAERTKLVKTWNQTSAA